MSEYSNSKYPIENPNIVKIDKVKENECKMVRSGRMVLLLPIVYVQFAISLWEYVSRGRGGDDIWSHKPRGTQRIRITANRGDPLRVKLEGGSKLCSLMSITGSNTR